MGGLVVAHGMDGIFLRSSVTHCKRLSEKPGNEA